MSVKPKNECNKIITEAKTLGFENEIPEGQLKNIIMNTRGVIDDRAINNWLKALLAFGYLEVKTPNVYRITNKT